MGCTQSKIENEEAVSRCKERKLSMKDAVAARNAFAAAQSAYAMALKNTGAALSDYAHAEVPHHYASSAAAALPNLLPSSSSSVAPPPAPPSSIPPAAPGLDSLFPPPPPLPNLETPPLQRAASMPEMIPKTEVKAPKQAPTIMEEDEEFEAHDSEKLVRKRSSRGKSGGGSGGGGSSVTEQRLMRGPPATQAMQQETGWDYFFFPSVESIPGPTLDEPAEEEPPPAKVYEEKVRRVEEKELPPLKAVVEEEKTVEMPVPVVPEKKVVKKGGGGGEGGRRVVKPANLVQIFTELDDHFLKASESAHEVSKMLEATRLHYHSNFADNRGHIDHSARVMRVITWNRSFRGVPDVGDGKDDFDSEEHETHATVLDKMLAWEKKLYDEVKAGEIMKFEYQRKVNSLSKQKKRGANPESLEKLKAAVSHLHTRYIVDMQSLDSTVLEINRLRDEQLYPKLVQLVDGMAIMWETMQLHHDAQSKIVNALRSWEVSQSLTETTEHHHDRTYQLWAVVQEWHGQFCKIIDHQKSYIKALKNWLKLNLIPIESNLREKVSSPPRVENPPIQALLIAWHDYLDALPHEGARTAINAFAAVVNAIMQHQEEEMKVKEKCEETQMELTRKTRQFEDWYNKYAQKRIPDELDSERGEENAHHDPVVERQLVVDQLKNQLKEEEESYRRLRIQVRDKSLASLKMRLPELFRAMCDISQACALMYKQLRNITERQNRS